LRLRLVALYHEGMNILSREAKSALMAAQPRQGAKIPAHTSQEVLAELVREGLVQVSGLTRRGVTMRQTVVSLALDEAFGV
jgi:hypothetical protein